MPYHASVFASAVAAFFSDEALDTSEFKGLSPERLAERYRELTHTPAPRRDPAFWARRRAVTCWSLSWRRRRRGVSGHRRRPARLPQPGPAAAAGLGRDAAPLFLRLHLPGRVLHHQFVVSVYPDEELPAAAPAARLARSDAQPRAGWLPDGAVRPGRVYLPQRRRHVPPPRHRPALLCRANAGRRRRRR